MCSAVLGLGITIFTTEWAKMSSGAWGVRGVKNLSLACATVSLMVRGIFRRACGEKHGNDESPAASQRV